MLISAHNILTERYRRISFLFDIGLMFASFSVLLLSVFEIVAPAHMTALFGETTAPFMVTGTATIFILSVIEWRISWKARSAAHFRAAEAYSAIKGQINSLLSRDFGDGDLRAVQIEDRYERLAQSCVQIPSNKFVRLKRAHLRKVALSRLLDDHPFACAMLVRLRLMLKQTAKGWTSAG
jgi:hypothetical protein